MGFFDLFKRQKTSEAKIEKVVFENKQKTQNENVNSNNENKKEFVADISLVEFHNVEWEDFGLLLKQNKILPNSYIKKPTEVEIKLSETKRPMVMLTFNSATSTSERKFMLLQDGAYQYVNGAIDDGKNPDLTRVWNKFKDEIRYYNKLETNREEYFQKQSAEMAIKTADKTKEVLTNLYQREQEFLEEYKNVKFDGFHYTYSKKDYIVLPYFIPLKEVGDGRYIDGEPVMPFTPKTLEHCILNMTNGQKIEDGEDLEEFEKKCKEIQENSYFESEDWEKVIEIGKDIVKNQYLASVISCTNEKEQ